MRSILFFITTLLAFTSSPGWAQEQGGTVYIIRPKANMHQSPKVYVNDVLAGLVLDSETLVMEFESDGRIAIQRTMHHEAHPLIINIRRGESHYVELRPNAKWPRLVDSEKGARLMLANQKSMHLRPENLQRVPLLPIP